MAAVFFVSTYPAIGGRWVWGMGPRGAAPGSVLHWVGLGWVAVDWEFSLVYPGVGGLCVISWYSRNR